MIHAMLSLTVMYIFPQASTWTMTSLSPLTRTSVVKVCMQWLNKRMLRHFNPSRWSTLSRSRCELRWLKKRRSRGFGGLATPRQHTNVLSSFIDASLVYGVDKKDFDLLRDTAKGQRLMNEIPHPKSSALHGLLPTTTEGFAAPRIHWISHVLKLEIKEPTSPR